MKSTDIPTKFQIPFGKSAAVGTIRPIPVADQTATAPGAASLTTGFPVATGQPIAAGGIPPSMQDFNGLLFQDTAWAWWQSAGGTVQFDAAFCLAVGGYPAGAILASTTAGVLWLNTVENNTTNPDAGNALGWVAIQTSVSLAATTRVVLKANLNVYVNGATGNDNNNGLTPTTAFATLQGAVNALAPAYDTAGFAITVNVAAGTYAPVYVDQAAALKLNFLGNTGNPSQVVVTSPNTLTPCFAVKRGSRINVQGFTLNGVGNGLDSNNLGQIEYGYINFANQSYNVSAFYVSQVTQVGPVVIAANCQGHLYAGIQSSINIAFGTIGSPQGTNIAFSVAFANANNGTILANGLTFAYISGAATGPRYVCFFQGAIYVAGAGANYLPGSTAGSVDASSTYQ